MGYVATNRDGQAVQASLGTADCQGIQQCLGWMFVASVTCVQDGPIDLLRQQIDRARIGVPHDQQIGVHRVQRQCCINQGFALFDRACLHRHVHHVGAKALARDLKACLRAGRVFKEHVDLCHARQNRFIDGPAAGLISVFIRQIQQCGDFGGMKMLDPQKMPRAECHRFS